MKESYVSDAEYATYYSKLAGIRNRIAVDLRPQPGMQVLDLATGPGYFAIELARVNPEIRITAIDVTSSSLADTARNARAAGLGDRIRAKLMDAARMDFADNCFHLVANFAGLEDIYMTSGRAGVEAVFREVARVLKPGGRFALAIMPPDEMESPAQRLEVALFSHICGATWLPSHDYQQFLKAAGLTLRSKSSYYTGKILTAKQAQEEIRFACEQVPKIYGIATVTFANAWSRFGSAIEKHGLGHFSKMVLLQAGRD